MSREVCLRCGRITDAPVFVRYSVPGSGPVRALYACPDCEPACEPGPEPVTAEAIGRVSAYCRLAMERPKQYDEEHSRCRSTRIVHVCAATLTAQRCDCWCHRR